MYNLTPSTSHQLNLLSSVVKDKNIFITGGTGFIGSYLVNALALHKAKVTVLTRDSSNLKKTENVKPFVADIQKQDTLRNCCTNTEILVHMAGNAHVEVQDDAHRNISIKGTENILGEANTSSLKLIIYISSVKAMGSSDKNCLDESYNECPLDYYGESRLQAENIILDWGIKNRVRTIILRLPLVYGPGVKGNIRKLLNLSKMGKNIPLPTIKNNRSMVYVGDVIQAIYCSIAHPEVERGIYIVTDGMKYSTTDLIDAINKSTGNRRKWYLPNLFFRIFAITGDVITFITRKKMPFNSEIYKKLFLSSCFKSEKIQKQMGFRPTETFYSVMDNLLLSD